MSVAIELTNSIGTRLYDVDFHGFDTAILLGGINHGMTIRQSRAINTRNYLVNRGQLSAFTAEGIVHRPWPQQADASMAGHAMGLTPNDPCWCGSRQQYGRCHGR